MGSLTPETKCASSEIHQQENIKTKNTWEWGWGTLQLLPIHGSGERA